MQLQKRRRCSCSRAGDHAQGTMCLACFDKPRAVCAYAQLPFFIGAEIMICAQSAGWLASSSNSSRKQQRTQEKRKNAELSRRSQGLSVGKGQEKPKGKGTDGVGRRKLDLVES
eukprot:3652170-Pleurochrysis_carterae.AAC.1